MFSEIVDIVIRRSNRPDFKDDIIAYLNEVIRYCHSTEEFYRDLVETEVDAIGEFAERQPTFVWDRPKDFRQLKAVKYLGYWENPSDAFPPNIPPGYGQRDAERYFYGVGNKFVFFDQCGLSKIAVAYLKAAPVFQYYESDVRPAKYDLSTKTWSYYDATLKEYVPTLGDELLDAAARDLVADWLLIDYSGMLVSGVLTKLFSVLSDPRNKVEYSNFKESLRYVRTAEKFESNGEFGFNR